VAWKAATGSRGKNAENPPPDPNCREATCSLLPPPPLPLPLLLLRVAGVCRCKDASGKRVAPTAVTHGDDAGHDGKSRGLPANSVPPLVVPAPATVLSPSTRTKSWHFPGAFSGLAPELQFGALLTLWVIESNTMQQPEPDARQGKLPSICG